MSYIKTVMISAISFDLTGAAFATLSMRYGIASAYIAVPCAVICLAVAARTAFNLAKQIKFDRDIKKTMDEFYQWREIAISEYRNSAKKRTSAAAPKRGHGRIAHLAAKHPKVRVRKKNTRRMENGKM